MLKNAINWFEIPVSDLARATSFYENMLQASLKQETMPGMDMAIFPYDDGVVSGGLVKADFMSPSDQGSIVYLNVEGFMDGAITRATEKGAAVVFPKTKLGECGYIAHIIDSEGNRIGLHSASE